MPLHLQKALDDGYLTQDQLHDLIEYEAGQLVLEILDDRGEVHKPTLNDWHIPTGWVTLEDVIRFCLHDLKAVTHCRREVWHPALIESTRKFRRDFAAPGEI